jgi:hypothetical protein
LRSTKKKEKRMYWQNLETKSSKIWSTLLSKFGVKTGPLTIRFKTCSKQSEKGTCQFTMKNQSKNHSTSSRKSSSQIQRSSWKCWRESKHNESTKRCWSTKGNKVMRMERSDRKEKMIRKPVHRVSITLRTLQGGTTRKWIQARSQRRGRRKVEAAK